MLLHTALGGGGGAAYRGPASPTAFPDDLKLPTMSPGISCERNTGCRQIRPTLPPPQETHRVSAAVVTARDTTHQRGACNLQRMTTWTGAVFRSAKCSEIPCKPIALSNGIATARVAGT